MEYIMKNYYSTRALTKKHGKIITSKIFQVIKKETKIEVSSIFRQLKLYPYFGEMMNGNVWECEDICGSFFITEDFANWLESNTDEEGNTHMVTMLGDFWVWHKMSQSPLSGDSSIIGYAKSLV
jgi:hypothetical protein